MIDFVCLCLWLLVLAVYILLAILAILAWQLAIKDFIDSMWQTWLNVGKLCYRKFANWIKRSL